MLKRSRAGGSRRWAQLLAAGLLALAAAVPARAGGWDDYQIIVWQPHPPERLAVLRRLGVTAAMLPGRRDAPLEPGAVAAGLAPLRAAGLGFYVENIATDFYAAYHRWTPGRPVTWLFDQARAAYAHDPADPAAFRRLPSLSDPAWRERIAARLQQHAALFGPAHPLFYDLGDETGIADLAAAWAFDFSPVALAAFRDWLRGRYGTLAALNAEWQSDFADWPAVRPLTTDEALRRRDGNFSAWADFRLWMDLAFADAVRAGSAALHAADPAALAGLEGAQAPGPGGYDYARLAPAVDVMEMYDHGGNIELARGFNPGLVLLTTNFGGTPRDRYGIWRALLLGARGLVLWDEGGDLLAADGTPGPRARVLAGDFAALRGGLGAQVMAAAPRPDPVAILYSQASFHARWLLDRLADGKPWSGRGSATEWDDDNAWRHALGAAIGTLAHAGLQPGFLSDAMVAAGALRGGAWRLLILPQAIALSPHAAAEIAAFAARGGVVAADAEPGRFDAHVRRLPAPLLAQAPLRRVAGFSRATLEPAWQAAGLAPAIRLLRADDGAPAQDVAITVLHSGAVMLLGLQRDLPASGEPGPAEALELVFDRPLLVRDLRGATPLLRQDRLPLRLGGPEPTLLALSPRELPGPVLSGPAEAVAGTAVTLRVGLADASPAGVQAVRLESFDPGGKPRAARAATLPVGPAGREWTLRLRPEDPPGRWLVRATDQLGGGTAVLAVTVRAAPR